MIDPKKEPFWERLLGVIEGASYVQKKGKNKEQGYNYAMEGDFLELVKPLLMKAGIVPLPMYEILANEQVQTQSGKPANLVTLKLTLTLNDAYSDECVEVQSIGQGRDPQDKACYKAMTGAMKYALAKAFLIPTGDDPENEEEEKESPVTMRGKVEEKKGTDPDDAFITAVQAVRYKVTPSVFAEVMGNYSCTLWPDHLLKLSRDQRTAFYKELLERTKKNETGKP